MVKLTLWQNQLNVHQSQKYALFTLFLFRLLHQKTNAGSIKVIRLMGFKDANILKSPPFSWVHHTFLRFPLDDLTLINGSSKSNCCSPALPVYYHGKLFTFNPPAPLLFTDLSFVSGQLWQPLASQIDWVVLKHLLFSQASKVIPLMAL